MLTTRAVVSIFLTAMTVMGGGETACQTYPDKPIRILTANPASNSDFTARLIAQGISGPLGQQVIVENRGAAGGLVAGQSLAKSPPDGYTLLLYGSGIYILSLLQDVPYDPVKDFSPLTLATTSPNALVVHPSLQVKSVKELIALAKARPGQLNFGIAGPGNSPHLSSELFKSMAGINIVRVDYRGIAAAITGLLGGETQLNFANVEVVKAHVKSGRLRALAVTSAGPSELFPGMPPLAASGLPGFEVTSKTVMFAPAKTPVIIMDRLNREIARLLHQPDVKERIINAGAEAVGSSPDDLTDAMRSEMARMGKLIKDVGLRGQ